MAVACLKGLSQRDLEVLRKPAANISTDSRTRNSRIRIQGAGNYVTCPYWQCYFSRIFLKKVPERIMSQNSVWEDEVLYRRQRNRSWNAVPTCILPRNNFRNSVPARSVKKIPQVIVNKQLSSDGLPPCAVLRNRKPRALTTADWSQWFWDSALQNRNTCKWCKRQSLREMTCVSDDRPAVWLFGCCLYQAILIGGWQPSPAA
jgi:hypothetical protein